MAVTHPNDPAHHPTLGRRAVIGIGIGTGIAALMTGCSSPAPRHGRVGDPIPDSPSYRPLPQSGRQPRPTVPPPSTGSLAIIGRQTWASRGPIAARADRMGHIEFITVHHDGMSPFNSLLFDDAARRLEAIRTAHVNKGWADIGYHYAIDPAGRVWAARPEALQGAHVKDKNPRNLGVLLLGNYEHQRPTEAAIRSIDTLVASKMDEFRVPVNKVYTHREWAPTACPGRHLQSHMQVARASGGSIRLVAESLRTSATA